MYKPTKKNVRRRNRTKKNVRRRSRTKKNIKRIRMNKKNKRCRKTKKTNSPLTTRFNRIFMMRGGDSHNAAAFPKGYTQPINNNANGLANMGAPYNAGGPGLPSGNHLPINHNVIDPPIPSNSQFGGKRKGKGKKGQNGGGVSSFISGLLPDELVNIGRSVPAAVGHMADKFNGEISMPSSRVFPTQQPHVTDIDRNTIISPVNMKQIYDAANAEVREI